MKKLLFALDLQKFAAAETLEGNPESDEGARTVSKEQYDKTASELAKYKKLYNDKLSDEEKANEQAQQEKQDLLDELETLKKEKKHSNIVAGLSKTGFDDKVINSIADSFINDDIASLTKNILKGIQDVMKAKDDEINKLKLEAIERPSGSGTEPKSYTRADVQKMSVEEKQKLYEEDPEAFERLYKK